MFELEGSLWAVLSKWTDYILLNILFVLFSLPIITLGASQAALYHMVSQRRKDEEGPLLHGFVQSFKAHWKPTTKLWLLFVLVNTLLGMNVYALTLISRGWFTMVYMAATTILFIFIQGTYWHGMMLCIHCKMPYVQAMIKGWTLTLVKLPQTLGLVLLWHLPLVLIFFFTAYTLYVLTFYVVIGFAVTASLWNILVEKTILQGFIH